MANVYDGLNIYQRLAKIRKMVEVIQKNKEGYGYKYVPEDEILAKVTAGMEKFAISLIPGIAPKTAVVVPYYATKTKFAKNGDKLEENINELTVCADMTFKWICNDNPEDFIEVPWFMVGQASDPSQAFGSGLTYTNRYFLLKYFQASTTEDDPDNWRSKKEDAASMELDKTYDELGTEIANYIEEYLAAFKDEKEHDDKKKALIAWVRENIIVDGKHTANYLACKDIKQLSSLLKNIVKEFPVEDSKSKK